MEAQSVGLVSVYLSLCLSRLGKTTGALLVWMSIVVGKPSQQSAYVSALQSEIRYTCCKRGTRAFANFIFCCVS